MSLLVEKPGILTTVQDLGRRGYRRLGINPGGAMDQTAVRLINIALGNAENEAVIEMHFPAPRLTFEAGCVFAVGGAEFGAVLDDRPLDNWRPHFAPKGSALNFSQKLTGNRAYLAVRGGFRIKKWLGSASTNLAAGIGGYDGRKLATGDRLALNRKFRRPAQFRPKKLASSVIPRYGPFPTARVTRGAEFEPGCELLETSVFKIAADSNRMGFRLLGEPIALTGRREIVSSAADLGTVQLLPDGQLIVLMADHQTTGGYPRLVHVVTRDLPLIAQLGANDKLAFHLIDHSDAEELVMNYERELNFLRVACRLQVNSWA